MFWRMEPSHGFSLLIAAISDWTAGGIWEVPEPDPEPEPLPDPPPPDPEPEPEPEPVLVAEGDGAGASGEEVGAGDDGEEVGLATGAGVEVVTVVQVALWAMVVREDRVGTWKGAETEEETRAAVELDATGELPDEAPRPFIDAVVTARPWMLLYWPILPPLEVMLDMLPEVSEYAYDEPVE